MDRNNNYGNKSEELNKVFKEFLKGQDFISWANSITENLIMKSGQMSYALKLSKLCPLLNVKEIKYVDSKINGYITIIREGFIINLSERLKIKKNNYNDENNSEYIRVFHNLKFVLAHEMAHILFYDTSSSPPRSLLVGLNQGSLLLEKACDILALALLLPRFLVYEHFNTFLQTRSKDGNIKQHWIYLITELSQKFDVSWDNVVKRVSSDLKIFSGLIYMKFVSDTEGENANNSYRLSRINISPDLVNRGLYIPYPRKKVKSISAKGIINEIIDESKSIGSGIHVINKSITSQGFKYFGNLDKFIFEKIGNDKGFLPIACCVSSSDSFIICLQIEEIKA